MKVPAGTRVALRRLLLEPHQRAPSLPADTARLPYEAVVRGLLSKEAELGAEAAVRTATGRLTTGLLEVVEPADTHSFGRPPRALVAVDEAITKLLETIR